MEIIEYTFHGEGMEKVYDNNQWIVGIKNWKPTNDIKGLTNLERHHKTDEIFALLSGKCTLIYANENEDVGLSFEKVEMEKDKVYCIPATLWHNTIIEKDTKLILIEAPDTSIENSDILMLSDEQILTIYNLITS